MIPGRSILSVPGNVEKMHRKAAESNTDIVLLDLEDSVSLDEKDKARELIVKSINEMDWKGKKISFRINNTDTPLSYLDLIYVAENAGDKIDSVVIPKVDAEDDVHFVSKMLDGIEKNKGFENKIKIEASIESAEGLERIDKIAAAGDRLISLVFGIADFSASIGAKNVSISGHGENEDIIYPGHRWNFVMSRIVMAAKANGLQAVDAPYGNFKDPDGLKKGCVIALSLGFDSKWAIHPSQIDTINELFAPDEEEIERALRVLKAAEEAEEKGRGAASIDGRMIDGATIRLARKTKEKAEFYNLI